MMVGGEYPNVIPLLRSDAAKLGVSDIADYVLGNEKFAVWSGSTQDKHHYGKAGLQHHTWEVTKLCSQQADFFDGLGHKLDRRVLFLCALYHDIGKVWDYAPVSPLNAPYETYHEWEGTPHKRVIHHISRSGIEWSRAVDKYPKYRDIEEKVLHAILSHHGLREWGSPVFPKSREAWVLHLCDSLSARMNENERIDLVHKV